MKPRHTVVITYVCAGLLLFALGWWPMSFAARLLISAATGVATAIIANRLSTLPIGDTGARVMACPICGRFPAVTIQGDATLVRATVVHCAWDLAAHVTHDHDTTFARRHAARRVAELWNAPKLRKQAVTIHRAKNEIAP